MAYFRPDLHSPDGATKGLACGSYYPAHKLGVNFPSGEASIGIRPPNGSESITRLASRVLFGNTLEEKLRLSRPESLVYDKPNAPELYRGVIPGRPENLGFASESETRPTFPRTPAMVEEESRGVLLHFFANHELLAAELMALAILKFPNAPRAFREGKVA